MKRAHSAYSLPHNHQLGADPLHRSRDCSPWDCGLPDHHLTSLHCKKNKRFQPKTKHMDDFDILHFMQLYNLNWIGLQGIGMDFGFHALSNTFASKIDKKDQKYYTNLSDMLSKILCFVWLTFALRQSGSEWMAGGWRTNGSECLLYKIACLLASYHLLTCITLAKLCLLAWSSAARSKR